jgi:hypothetical protein
MHGIAAWSASIAWPSVSKAHAIHPAIGSAMPGLTTHTYILYKTLRSFEGAPPPLLAPIVHSHLKALEHACNNDSGALASDAEAVLQGCAYIGACGPDLFYLEMPPAKGAFLADLLHYNRTGPFIIRWLYDGLAGQAPKLLSNPLLQRRLAYCLGHISHIAADIVLHPFVNSIVGAYPKNAAKYFDARGVKPMWKFHNKLEHYQDAYVLHRHFIDEHKFCAGNHFGPNDKITDVNYHGTADLACLNLALPAALRFYKPDGVHFMQSGWRAARDFVKQHAYDETPSAPLPWLGLVRQTRAFYAYAEDLIDIENDKYGFFADVAMSGNYMVNVSHYYDTTIPQKKTMEDCPHLVQAPLLDAYIDKAVAVARQMWTEVVSFFGDCSRAQGAEIPQTAGQMARLSARELAAFEKLGRHWNLDCGLFPSIATSGGSRDVPGTPDTKLHVAGQIVLKSIHAAPINDVTLYEGRNPLSRPTPVR